MIYTVVAQIVFLAANKFQDLMKHIDTSLKGLDRNTFWIPFAEVAFFATKKRLSVAWKFSQKLKKLVNAMPSWL